jgi:putative transcriptional regulator
MNQIKAFRNKRSPKITQDELAEHIGYKKRRLANYETGHRTPKITNCQDITRGFNELNVPCTLDDVFPSTRKAA